MNRPAYTYITLRGEVGLHSHGVFHHQLGSDFTEQIKCGDTRHQAIRCQPFIVTICGAGKTGKTYHMSRICLGNLHV